MKNQIALVPAYKPDKELLHVVEELAKENFRIIVVNDGSGEDYDEIFRLVSGTAEVLTHAENQGKGEALKTGLRYIAEQISPPYLVVTADADGQHKIEDILHVCRSAEQFPDSLVLGSRRFDGKVPFRSRFGNTVTRLVYRLNSGVSVYDTQTGLRAFSDKLIPLMLSIPGSRYEYEMNVLMETAKQNIPVREIPIAAVYLENNASSHFRPVQDSCRIYKEILKFSASSFISFLADYGLFCLCSSLTGMLTFSNVTARIFSSILNYTLNQKLVFHSESSTVKSAVRYFLLAGAILLCNTLLLKGFVSLGISAWAAKIFTESLLFICSYLVQHQFVFRKGHTV